MSDSFYKGPQGNATKQEPNLGFELLGHALACASGSTYAEMVRRRVAGPLGLTTPAVPEELRPTALVGTSRSGRPGSPWTGKASGPGGGIHAGVEDMRFSCSAS